MQDSLDRVFMAFDKSTLQDEHQELGAPLPQSLHVEIWLGVGLGIGLLILLLTAFAALFGNVPALTALIVLSLGWLAGIWHLRRRLLQQLPPAWPKSCPHCENFVSFQRIERRWYHRLPALLALKTIRCNCARCGWRGLLTLD